MYLPRTVNVQEQWDGVLCVPFGQKDTVKALGAAWDATRRTWVVPPGLRARRRDFQKWDTQAPPAEASAELQAKRASITRELARALRAVPA